MPKNKNQSENENPDPTVDLEKLSETDETTVVDTEEPEETETPAEATEEAPAETEETDEAETPVEITDEQFAAEMKRRGITQAPAETEDQETEYPDLDTERETRASNRVMLITELLSDVRSEEPDLPKAYMDRMKSDLMYGVLQKGGGRRALSLEELQSMYDTGSLKNTASGIVRQLQKAGQLKVKSNAPPPKAPNNTTGEAARKMRPLTAEGQRLAAAMARSNGIPLENLTGKN